MVAKDILIGIDAGTSVVKSVAFDLNGRQLAVASVRNQYDTRVNGAATQNMRRTWGDCVQSLCDLTEKIPDLATRTLAVSVTGQGDGTWLINANDEPVGDAWLWLDARSAPTVEKLSQSEGNRDRFELTGTGLNTCQQGSQLAHMATHEPSLIKEADCALHCKDWLYLNLTGIRATDPSEASFTFGNFRNRQYSDQVIEALGLSDHKGLLPEIIDGTQVTHPLSDAAARATGLLQGTPVSLGYVDMVMTALGAGVHTGEEGVACSVIGSTGVHMRSVESKNVYLNDENTGYVILLPIENRVTQVQTSMSATLNLDWLLTVAADLMSSLGQDKKPNELLSLVNDWLESSAPGQILYHPYISEAGERGPFVNANACASFVGLSYRHRFPDLVRSIIEGLGMSMRDCYLAMGGLPQELRISGGAARSDNLRAILAASVGAKVRVSTRDEAGAAGVAMMAAVANGIYPSMDDCINQWVTPLLSDIEPANPSLTKCYSTLYPQYFKVRESLVDSWKDLAALREANTNIFKNNEQTAQKPVEVGA